jgi:hypothetical protein
MVGMRMVYPDNVQRSLLEFLLDSQHVQRIHVIAIASPFFVQVFAGSESLDDVILVFVRGPDHQTATFIRI